MDPAPAARPGLLDRARTIAPPGFNRWLVPPAALAIHLCIGMAYGFSVFWLPLSRAVGVGQPVACPAGTTLLDALVVTSCDWRVADLSWIYTLFFVLLGCAAAIWGGWLERVGPRKAASVAALCWCGGLLIAAAGVALHQLWMLWLGAGVIGGIGLGLGYISPVSTLIKWFPDRRGMATGMAIMGFGGGALIGAPLADLLMGLFRGPASVGVWQTFVALSLIYLVFMLGGAFGYRLPPPGWTPAGWTPPPAARATAGHVALGDAHRTPQFWLIWAVLCLNVSAGIGIIGMASPMLQEIFGGGLIGRPELGYAALDDAQRRATAAIAAGFTGVLSLFNIGGRFAWASLSDAIGRKATYLIFFLAGALLYATVPWAAHQGGRLLFVAFLCVIVSMYGGGFATIPAYIADLFGTRYVAAIHGRVLTAWSVAGVLGPVLVTYVREAQLAAGVARDRVYDTTLLVVAGWLALGFVANLLIRPVAARWIHPDDAPAAAPPAAGPAAAGAAPARGGAILALAWLSVGLPLGWGVWVTLREALRLLG